MIKKIQTNRQEEEIIIEDDILNEELKPGKGNYYSVVGLVCPRSEEQISEPIAV